MLNALQHNAKESLDVDHTFSVLSICSGTGAGDLALRLAVPGARTLCYVEREAYAIGTLVRAVEEGSLAEADCWTDVKTFDGRPWRGHIDCIVASYPCQPFSIAGRRRGVDDERHLWPHIARIIRETEPALVFIENVRNHLRLGFDSVCRDLWGMGYDTRAGLFSAEEIGAPHQRVRLFALAYARRQQHERRRIGGDVRGAEAEEHREALQRQRDGDAAGDGGADVAGGDGDRSRLHSQDGTRGFGCHRQSEQSGADVAVTESAGGRIVAGSGGIAAGEDGREIDNRRTAPQTDGSDATGYVMEQLAVSSSGGRGVLRQPPGSDGLADGRGGDVADAEDAHGRRSGEAHVNGWWASQTGGPGGDLGHAECAGLEGRAGERGDIHAERAAAERAGVAVGHAGSVQPEQPERFRPERGEESGAGPYGEFAGSGCGLAPYLFPPHRTGDWDRWSDVLVRYPWLRPSISQAEIESNIQRMADGLADLVGKHRAHKLRAIGNGIVPATMALAFMELAIEHGIGRWGPDGFVLDGFVLEWRNAP
jgi:DNA (cytosine-5)-methyltransferase 1